MELTPLADVRDRRCPRLWLATSTPAPLLGMSLPGRDLPFETMAQDFGVGAMVSLTGAEPWLDCAPLRWLGFGLDDLYDKAGPADPVKEWHAVADAAGTVKALLNDGVGTIVHCEGGRGRTGTVIGAVGVSFGLDADDVAAWLDEAHRASGGWPECEWQRLALDSLVAGPAT